MNEDFARELFTTLTEVKVLDTVFDDLSLRGKYDNTLSGRMRFAHDFYKLIKDLGIPDVAE